jgi:hypothetical protein
MTKRTIVDDFMRELFALYPQTSVAEALDVATRLHQTWGGERTYIPKAVATQKARALAAELAAGVPLAAAMRAAGVSRRTGYRLLARKWNIR